MGQGGGVSSSSLLRRRDSIADLFSAAVDSHSLTNSSLRYGAWLVEVKRVGLVSIVSHVTMLQLHIDKHLHLVGFVRIPLPSEQGSALSDKISEVCLTEDLMIDLVLRHLINR